LADVKISQLDDVGTPADEDLIPVVDVSANVTKKVTIGVIRGIGGIVGSLNAYIEIDSFIHADTHIKDGDDEIDGDKLDIDLTPTNYTPEVSAVSDDVAHLASHLAGIDAALGSIPPPTHAPSHITGGTDEVDGDKLDVDWTPSHYTPKVTAQSDNLDHLASHLAGIDTKLGAHHAGTHLTGGADEINGDRLDIDWNPVHYTPEITPVSGNVNHLAGHLAGIDTKFGQSATPAIHHPSHISEGTDELDGDTLDIDWTPANYTPTTTTEADHVDHLTAHLAGIDALLANLALNSSAGLATDHSAIGLKDTVTVDANTNGFGNALFLGTLGHYLDADADSASTMPCSALALQTGTGTKEILLLGFIRDDSWSWTPGGLVYVSPTQGTLTQTIPTGAGKFVQVAGIARSATILFFNPSYVMVERTS
jgi:hypothetical protein